MLMKTILLITTTIFSLNLFAQKDHDQILRDFLEQRRKMMEQMMKHFDDDFFKMDDDIKDFGKLPGNKVMEFSSNDQAVKVERKQNADGSIELHITPKDKNVEFEINTDKDMVTIKGKSTFAQKDESKKGMTSSTIQSSFQQSYGIPSGYKALDPVQQDETIILKLVPKDSSTQIKNFKPGANPTKIQNTEDEKKPLKPVPGDITI